MPVRRAGIDVGGTNTKVAVLQQDSPGGEFTELVRRSHPTGAAEGAAAVVGRTAALAAGLTEEFGVESVGVGLPGLFDPDTGCARQIPNIPGPWEGLPVRGPVEAACGRPVHLVNDARAFALAESRLGAGQGLATVVCLTLGTGLGGGLVVDGRLHHGTGGAGELGHQVLQPDGPPCGCGNRGCAEALIASAAVLRASGCGSVEEAWRAASAGEARAAGAVAATTGWLAQLVANAQVVLAPDAFVIGGGVTAAGEALFGRLRQEVRRRVHLGDPAAVRIVPAALGTYAGALGAALAAGAEADRARPAPVPAARPGAGR